MGAKTVGAVVAEEVLRGLVKAVGLRAVTIGLLNAMVGGQCLEHAGYHVDDEQLDQMFRHLDGLHDIAKKIEEAN